MLCTVGQMADTAGSVSAASQEMSSCPSWPPGSMRSLATNAESLNSLVAQFKLTS